MTVTRKVFMELGAKQAASLKASWSSMGRGMDKIQAGAKKMVNAFLSLKGIIVGAVVVKGFQFIKQSIKEITDAAGRAGEIDSKFRAVFKHLSEDTEKWAADVSGAVNRSDVDLKKYLATLQDTFVPLGFARKEAAQFSKDLTRLGLDLASFNNIADEDAIRDLQSAIVGNHETMRKYGVIISQATLDQKLLQLGFKTSAKGATEQEKAIARLKIIIEGTSDAQGDAERTSGSWVNTMKGLNAAWEKMLITMGGFITESPAVKTILADIVSNLKEGVKTLDKWGPVISETINAALKETKELAKDTSTFLGDVVEGATWGLISTDDIKKNLEVFRRMIKLREESRNLAGKTLSESREAKRIEKERQRILQEQKDAINQAKRAQEEANRRAKEELATRKKIAEQEEKRFQSMAKQFGMMSSIERREVKMLADRLKGKGGFEEFMKLGKQERSLIGRSKILQELAKPHAQKVAEQEIGSTLTQVSKITDLRVKVENKIKAELNFDLAGMTKSFTEKVFPRILEMSEGISERVTNAIEKQKQIQRANAIAAGGGSIYVGAAFGAGYGGGHGGGGGSTGEF